MIKTAGDIVLASRGTKKELPLQSKPSSISERWNNKALFRLIWPLIIEQVLAVTMGTADTIMVSSVGEHAVSGVNIIDNINNLLIIAFTALSTGGAVVVSQYLGRKDPKNANLAGRQLVYVVTLVSLVLMLVALCLGKPIITLFYGNIEADVMGSASVYFLITALSYPALAVYSAAAALYRASGNSKVTMGVALFVNVIHIAGNALFIYSFKIGAAGAALSTLISRLLAAYILTRMLIRNRKGQISLDGLFQIKLVRSTIISICNVGIPSGIESSMFQVGRLLTQRIFTTFGTVAFAANAVASVINSFSFMPGMAFGIALLTVVGQCVGAGDYEAAKRFTFRIMRMAFIIIFISSVLILIFLAPLVNLFNLSPEANTLAKSFLRIHCISMAIGWAFSFALPNALRAAGDARFVMVASAITMWVVRVSMAYFLAFVVKAGPISVWLAMGLDFLARGSIFFNRWRKGKWQNKKVIKE